MAVVEFSSENGRLVQLLERMLASKGYESCEHLRTDFATRALSVRSLEAISEFLKNREESKETLTDYLINGAAPSKLSFPAWGAKSREATPSMELQKRREFLKLRAEARAYNRMVYGSDEDPRVAEILNKGNHMASARNQLAVSANMVMSVLACFAISYYAGKSFRASNSACLIYGLVGGMFILVVEMALFIVRAMRADEVTSRDQKKIEAQRLSGGLATGVLEREKEKVIGGTVKEHNE
jgi:Endoplasmic reticulum-based factor for assembly of V-ATPase